MTARAILAVLQNQWFHDPVKVRAILERTPAARRRIITYSLFAGCRTGQVLRQVFGDRCNAITWEEASPAIGGQSSSCFPADLVHLQALLNEVKPDIVLAFGRIASDALVQLVPASKLIIGPHPTARGANVLPQLHAMRARLEWRKP